MVDSDRLTARGSEEASGVRNFDNPGRRFGNWQLILCGLAAIAGCLGAAAPWSLSHGLLFSALGLLMACSPPDRHRPTGWYLLASAWLCCSLLAYLPAEWCGDAPWRDSLAGIGVRISDSITPQPWNTATTLLSMSASGCISLWAIGRSCSGNQRMGIAMFLMLLVCLLTAADHGLRALGQNFHSLPDFGFFPNRNHSATLIVMGMLLALGVFIQSIHERKPWVAGTSLMAFMWLTGSILLRSQSRSVVLLIPASAIIWYGLIDKRRYLRGNAGKSALLLLLAVVLAFAVSDSPIKRRIFGSSSQFHESIGTNPPGHAVDPHFNSADSIDGRVAIARDTWKMIAKAPWTGWGAGQFAFVFPMYRTHSAKIGGSEVIHPESSWLWIAADCGLPALLCLLALVAWVFASAARHVKRNSTTAKALRAACLAAATVPFIHGFFDVPTHRVGILWLAAVLASLALPDRSGVPNLLIRRIWRGIGFTIFIWGSMLFHGTMTGNPLPNWEHTELLTKRAYSTYLNEIRLLSKQMAESQDRTSECEDPLEAALKQLAIAVELTPMDAHAHGLRGMLALHYDDKDELARKSFAAQRALNPASVELPAIQGDAWSRIDTSETTKLWCEAMRRARAIDARFPDNTATAMLVQRLKRSTKTNPGLTEALALACKECGQGTDIGNNPPPP